MSSTIEVSFSIIPSDPSAELGVEVWLDHANIFDCNSVDRVIDFKHSMPDEDGEHVLEIKLKNKKSTHTKIDKSGQIIKDACITIERVAFDSIELGQVLVEQACYTHDFNGTAPTTQETFYGTMGCNGTVSLKFSTPVYLWLLENM